jgi:hypothetical protein
VLRYHDHVFPLDPSSLAESAGCRCSRAAGLGAPGLPRGEARRPAAADGHRAPGRGAPPPRQGGAARAARAPLPRGADVAAAIDAEVTPLNGDPTPSTRCRPAELPAGAVAHREPRPRLPALLRHQRPGGPAHRGSRGLRREPRAADRVGRARLGSGAADRPSRRPARPGRVLPAPARGVPRRLDRGREDPRARRAAAGGLAGRRDDRLRLPERGWWRTVRRSGGEHALTRPTSPSPARRVDVRRAGARLQAAGARTSSWAAR